MSVVLEPAPTPPPPSGPAHIEQKSFGKKDGRRRAGGRTAVEELTSEEREAVTIVFHQYETGLREGTIFTKVTTSLEISYEIKTPKYGCSLLRIFALLELSYFYIIRERGHHRRVELNKSPCITTM